MLPPNLESIINAITGFASPIIKDKLERSEIVIQLLNRFNLAPEHPPADFSGVYAYALVEYGVGQPKPILELFRLEQIKQAFRKAFDHNNPSILLSEVDTFIEGYALGDEIKALGINVRREIAAFYIVFSEVAKRSRTPAEVLTNQAIASLHQKMATLTLTLDRLPTLEGIRAEMARLASQSYPALSEGSNQCQAIALAEQMRGWVETLGYGFEKHEIWAEDYFEFILKIPIRRSFDRILVRGVAGEVGLSDVMALAQSVQEHKTDEGWLVSTRRISRAAREFVKKEENHRLDCYTFDELIDLDADFSGYLDWLEAEIKKRKIDTKYVSLACTKEEIDPVSKLSIGVSRYEEEDGWIDGYIDLWLDDPAKEHISVLGEFGTGKTWFALHYAWVALQRYRDAQKRGVERPRLPLVITLRDYAKALNVENVLAGFFFTQHNIRLNSDVFDQLNRMGKLLLIFDGFDEMAAKCDRQQMINNFWELAKVVVPGAKVILTCRTEHFPEAKEGRALLNAELLASTANLTGETPQFEVLELEKFNDDQIRQVLSLHAQPTTVEQVMGNPHLLDLARRPVMTELILEALPDIEIGKPVDMSRVYLYAVRRKMERDIKAERTFTSLADKLYFLCELSWEMLSTDQMSLNYRLFPDCIRHLFGSVVQEKKDLDHWHYDMMGQTMLSRNADGDYTPAHRSLLEFFVAYKFAAELGALALDFTELAREQSCLDGSAAPVDYTWSGYFARQLDGNGRCVAIAPLKAFTSEPLEKLRETVGRSILTRAVMDLLVPMVDFKAKEAIIKVIEGTRFRSEDEVGYVGGNAATLAVKVDKTALETRDFSGAVVKGADFSDAILRDAYFIGANLAESVFPKIFGAVFCVAYSHNGELFAAADGDCRISIWLTKDVQQVLKCKGHNDWIRSVVFSPNAHILASASYDHTVRLWDTTTGVCIKIVDGHRDRVNSVAFSPDGKILASGSRDQTIKLWNPSTGECLKTLDDTSNIRTVAFSPDGKMLATGGADKTVKLWDISTRKCLKIFKGHADSISSVVFSSDGINLVSGGRDKTVKLWDVATGDCLKSFEGHTDTVRSVAVTKDCQIIVSSSKDKTVKLWDVKTEECTKTLEGHNGWVRSIAISPDGTHLISGSEDQTIRQWDIVTGKCLKILHGSTSWVRSVAISPNGRNLASCSEDATIKVWDIVTGKCLQNLQGHQSRVNSVAISPNGKTLASCSYDRTIKLWNIRTNKCLKTLYAHTGGANSVTFSSDGLTLVSGSGDNTIKIWDTQTGEPLKILRGHTDWVWFVTISPNNEIIASSSYDKTVRLWDFRTGECLKIIQGHTSMVSALAISPNNSIVASASPDKTIRLWNIHDGKCLKTLYKHTVNSIAFSPDGHLLASAGHDKQIIIWDADAGKCIKILSGHNSWVSAITFSPDGQTLISGSRDDTIKVWDIQSSECLKTFNNKPYASMKIKDVKGLTSAEIATLKALGAVENGEI